MRKKSFERTSRFRRLYGKTSISLANELKVSVATIRKLHIKNKLNHLRICEGDGFLNPKIAKIHNNIWGRCNDPRVNKYEYYGGRGIKCLITIKDLESIWERDEAYKLKTPSIDRIDPKGNYEFSNCRFIEYIQNIKNREYKRATYYSPKKKFSEIMGLFKTKSFAKYIGLKKFILINYRYKKASKIKEKNAFLIIKALEKIKEEFFSEDNFESMFDKTDYMGHKIC